MDWSGGAPLYESPNSVAFTSCWLYSASPINSLCMLIEDTSLTVQRLGNCYPLPPWHSSHINVNAAQEETSYYIVQRDRVGVRRERHMHVVLVPLSRFELVTCSNAQF